MNPAVAERPVQFELTLFAVLVIHGNLCLALRHPGNNGPSATYAREIIRRLGETLVAGGMLTQAELDHAEQIEIAETRRLCGQDGDA